MFISKQSMGLVCWTPGSFAVCASCEFETEIGDHLWHPLYYISYHIAANHMYGFNEYGPKCFAMYFWTAVGSHIDQIYGIHLEQNVWFRNISHPCRGKIEQERGVGWGGVRVCVGIRDRAGAPGKIHEFFSISSSGQIFQNSVSISNLYLSKNNISIRLTKHRASILSLSSMRTCVQIFEARFQVNLHFSLSPPLGH